MRLSPFISSGKPALVLAPMDGITDAPMRALMAERGGFSFFVSEFIRVSQEVTPLHVFRRHLPDLHPQASDGFPPLSLQAQLLGGDPERMALSALNAVKVGVAAVDINFGCPAPTVNRHDGGASLLKCPDRIRRIVSEVRRALPRSIPVSAKLRLGWDSADPLLENCRQAVEGGASWLTIHGRTRVQGYSPPVMWKPIGMVQRELGVPVIANGDIWTVEDFLRCQEETRCEHFMLGRGAIADPHLPLRIAHQLGLISSISVEKPISDKKTEWFPLLSRFAVLSEKFTHASPGYTLARLKQWVRISHLRRPIPWFELLKRAQCLEQAWAFLS